MSLVRPETGVAISAVEVLDDRRVRLKCEALRELFVHELHYAGVRSEGGGKPWHDSAFYTLNRIPSE